MKLGKGLRSAAAMVLSVATLLPMGALGVGTANADTTVDVGSTAYKTGSITITGGKDHTFDYAQIAKFTFASTDTGTNLSGVSVETTQHAADIASAIHTADSSVTLTGDDATNPVAWLGKNWTDQESVAPYSGKIRDFVTAVASSLAYTTPASPVTSTDNGNDRVINNLPVGVCMC
ncbi:MAG: hypothetical protein J6575_06760 [Bifidobacterium sp.]|nr:hypothetical protein [Bifidobacterium sp.]